MEMYPDRKTRDDVLDAYVRNLPPLAREIMATIGMSEQEYRQRLEQCLFGPQLSISTGSVTSSVTSVPVKTWQDMPTITSGSVTIPADDRYNITYN